MGAGLLVMPADVLPSIYSMQEKMGRSGFSGTKSGGVFKKFSKLRQILMLQTGFWHIPGAVFLCFTPLQSLSFVKGQHFVCFILRSRIYTSLSILLSIVFQSMDSDKAVDTCIRLQKQPNAKGFAKPC